MSQNSSQLTVDDLFNIHRDRLALSWVAGQQSGKRCIVPEEIQDNGKPDTKNTAATRRPDSRDAQIQKPLVGYLNLIHPHQIQVLGQIELEYIDSLRDISREDAIRQLFKHQPACIIIADDSAVPILLKRRCNENNTPLFKSSLSSKKLTDSLHYYLANFFADAITLHGVFMEINALGVLITGPSGIGKSEVALELITRGHRLVADDAPEFSRIAPDIINGICPPALQDFLEVRGLGVINVRQLFGDSAIKLNKYLRLIVRLVPMEKDQLLSLDRLEGSNKNIRVLDLEIPEVTLPVAPGRNLAVLLECAARNHMLRITGYDAVGEFSERQRVLIEQKDKK